MERTARLALARGVRAAPRRGLHGRVAFVEADATTFARIAADVRRSLRRWEPRIDVRDVVVTADPDDQATLYIDIRYTIGSANDPRNLVFPFYVIPAEE